MDVQRRISDWITEHNRGFAIALVLVFGTGSTIALATCTHTASERPADWLGYALIWGSSASAYWYRTKPLPALLVCLSFLMCYWVLDYAGSGDPAALFLFYAATRHGGNDRQKVWRVVLAGLVVAELVAIVGVIVPTEELPAIALIGILIIHGTFAVVGEALYQRSRHIEELEQRAAALEADLENKAALAAVDERTRIAREMHDIIAHGMSTVVVQAQAGQSVVDSNPDKAREVLQTIENIGRNSVEEMRRMLGVLRHDDSEPELVPQPGFDDLDELRTQVAVAGVALNLTVTGDSDRLPPGLELTGYRIVQEALTNVLRHAGRPVQVTAHIDCDDGELSVSVTDDGIGAAATDATAGSGHGLRGMRERVEIYNGTFTTGPMPGGGFRVHATLPLPAVSQSTQAAT